MICAGGGGISVIKRDDGSLMGSEAVVDKDAATALLAQKLAAGALLLLTDVDALYHGFGTLEAAALAWLTPDEARAFDAAQILAGEKGTRIALSGQHQSKDKKET